MKKSTKIISTTIAIVLVMSFMVVGILAATSASAVIGARISWSAEQGIAFTLDIWTCYSAEHYDSINKNFPIISSHKLNTISVDTFTTNQSANGITQTLNANFIDVIDDGVNNPSELYYLYLFKNYTPLASENSIMNLIVSVDAPETSDTVKAELRVRGGGDIEVGEVPEDLEEDWEKYEELSQSNMYFSTSRLFILKLTLLDPNNSVINFDASIQFQIEFGYEGADF